MPSIQKLDKTDEKLLSLLFDDARMSLKDLAVKTGMSAPSISERLARLQRLGVIRSFTVEIDEAALGYALEALVRVRPLPGQLHVVGRLIDDTPEVVECDKVTGDDCFLVRLVVPSMERLDAVLDRISDKAATNTAIVKSKTVRRRFPPFIKEQAGMTRKAAARK